MQINHTIHASTACFPGMTYEQALKRITLNQTIEAWGVASAKHVQLCPQTTSVLSATEAQNLKATFSQSKLRLHANVRRANAVELFDASRDIASSGVWLDYLKDIKKINDALGKPDYSIHAGRETVKFEKMISNLLKIQDFLGCKVALEGLYPSQRVKWAMKSFEDYEKLLSQDIHWAIDLSHVQIIQSVDPRHSLQEWSGLLKSLLEDKRCIEVHVSNNNCLDDTHEVITNPAPWWWQVFNDCKIHQTCCVFTEGSQVKARQRGYKF